MEERTVILGRVRQLPEVCATDRIMAAVTNTNGARVAVHAFLAFLRLIAQNIVRRSTTKSAQATVFVFLVSVSAFLVGQINLAMRAAQGLLTPRAVGRITGTAFLRTLRAFVTKTGLGPTAPSSVLRATVASVHLSMAVPCASVSTTTSMDTTLVRLVRCAQTDGMAQTVFGHARTAKPGRKFAIAAKRGEPGTAHNNAHPIPQGSCVAPMVPATMGTLEPANVFAKKTLRAKTAAYFVTSKRRANIFCTRSAMKLGNVNAWRIR